MTTQKRKLDFTGQEVFVGIDVHKKSWKISIHLGDLEHKTFSQDPDPQILSNYLRRNFPGAKYKSVYESGFCGFWIHEALTKLGIENLVVNASDVPTTDKEKRQKRDKRDARKLAKTLRSNQLEGIYVPSRQAQEVRSLLGTRYRIVKNMTRCKNQIKSHPNFMGIAIPFKWHGRYWSNKFIEWLSQLEFSTTFGKASLDALILELKALRSILANLLKTIHELSKSPEFQMPIKLLQSLPGVGLISSMVIYTELVDIRRFKNLDRLASYVGLIPDVRASRESEKVGDINRRGNTFIKAILIQCAWRAAREDPALLLVFQKMSQRMKKNQAIIRIAKKLLSRIRFVLLNNVEYQTLVI